jgi:NAD-dependent deacetylase
MIAPDVETGIARLRDLIDGAQVVVPFTGAGISTECGIPDFRSPGGIWTKNRPIPFDEFLSSQEMRNEAWRRRFAMEEHFSKARPGRGHLALASLYRVGKAPGVVTQNIDNLHQSSGISHADVVELHGNNTYVRCACVAPSAMSYPGSRTVSMRQGRHPIAMIAVVTSSPRRCHSDRPCRKRRCSVPKK